MLDLADEALAAAYEDWHRPGRVPAGVLADIVGSGITVMEIYRAGDRLVMITETSGEVPAGDRVASEASAEWEKRMDAFQKPLPGAPPGVKWLRAQPIFDLADHINTKEMP
ncbi:L-rhamnose mutarotase [Novosphingobium aromaticivorans]|nr:L-rhamnose mutarotase [Novosphingobium aromaticivorans]